MENVTIQKAKIKENLFLEVKYTEELENHSKKKITMTCTVPVHQDLKDAFANLRGHLILLSDTAKKRARPNEFDEATLEKYEVLGFVISGHDEDQAIQLIGNLEGAYGTVHLTTPAQKYSNSDYKHIDELGADLEACLYEVDEYLFNNKRAPDAQLELFPSEEEEAAEQTK